MTGRPLRGIQQIQLGTACNTESDARTTLAAAVDAGFECIELNGYMIRPASIIVRALTRAAGMPTGRGGRLDWAALVAEAGLTVIALHEDLGRIEQAADEVVADAARLRTARVVVTGMHRFDYTDPAAIRMLSHRLNSAGAQLAEAGLRLLYHNHNAELRRVAPGRTVLAELIASTGPGAVGFEVDAYWLASAGADPVDWMQRLGPRAELLHLTDRGTRRRGRSLTPIDTFDSVELGDGNLNLAGLVTQARSSGTAAVVLESHRNWIDGSPVASMQRSAIWLRDALDERKTPDDD